MTIKDICHQLINHKIGIIPHDTIPGIVSTISIDNALKINKIKCRPKKKGFIILIPSLVFLDDFVDHISTNTQRLIDQFWPGPLTLIFDKKDHISPIISGSPSTIAIRYPKHNELNNILTVINQSLISTSANISDAFTISNELIDAMDFIYPNKSTLLNYNYSKNQTSASTIVDARKSKPLILRKGEILQTDLLNC